MYSSGDERILTQVEKELVKLHQMSSSDIKDIKICSIELDFIDN